MGEKRLGSEIKDETPHNGDLEGREMGRPDATEGIPFRKEKRLGRKEGFICTREGGGSLGI